MRAFEIAVAKTHKYASRDSGDTVETAERPTGGVSVVMVDGQGSGHAAKSLSMMVSSKAVSLLKEGVRDGAVARGTHDFLHAFRHGKVSATIDIVSVDLASRTLVVTRNSVVPYYILGDCSGYSASESISKPIGLYRHTRPAADQLECRAGLQVIMFSDGVSTAGVRRGEPFDPVEFMRSHFTPDTPAQAVADGLLQGAIDADQGRPYDDMTVVAVAIIGGEPYRRSAGITSVSPCQGSSMPRPRIAVVGHCASGKTTITRMLSERGIDAYSVAQEHSIVRDLWQHLDPDLVVYLDVSLAGIRQRKNNDAWPEWIYDEQARRLEHARRHADLEVDTDSVGPEAIVDRIQRALDDGRETASSPDE